MGASIPKCCGADDDADDAFDFSPLGRPRTPPTRPISTASPNKSFSRSHGPKVRPASFEEEREFMTSNSNRAQTPACALCLEGFEKDSLANTKCKCNESSKFLYHETCLKRWSNPKCPQCGSAIELTSREDLSLNTTVDTHGVSMDVSMT